MEFKLPLGIDIPDASGLSEGVQYNSGGDYSVTAVLSPENLETLLYAFVEGVPEPAFFFLELPCTDDEEKALKKENADNRPHYKLYYLDNCTRPVLSAIIKEYGTLLINDGISRFGFGSNEYGDELYVQSYNVASLYFTAAEFGDATLERIKKTGVKVRESLRTPWDIISPENPGTCVCIEDEGITVYDLPELLANAGMYFSEIV